jgi:coenzyme F420 hydrogenase subunit delta
MFTFTASWSSTLSDEVIPEYASKRVLILGVGNVLFGDDGFGPAAADYLLSNCRIPKDVHVMDVGIGAGDILFNIALSPKKPQKIIILDAVKMKKKAGEVFKLSIDELPVSKLSDFSTHFFPATSILRDLRDQMNIEIAIVACQAKRVTKAVSQGLSDELKKALPKAARMALELAKEAKRKN